MADGQNSMNASDRIKFKGQTIWKGHAGPSLSCFLQAIMAGTFSSFVLEFQIAIFATHKENVKNRSLVAGQVSTYRRNYSPNQEARRVDR